jgi:tripeptide aminopeptidase
MVNAVTLASAFVSELPRNMAPETTENYEGFIAPMEISGSIESANVEMLLRSFNIEEIEKEKEIIKATADRITAKFGGSCEVNFKQQYLNMKEKLDQHPEIMQRLEQAYKDSGVKVRKQPIRGGTDGSRLTELGIPTPNIFTGAHEFHSRNEWLSLNQCAKSADVLINLLTQKVK